MGEVWRATDTALGRAAAVKLLRDDLDLELRARLIRESEAAARLQHPAIATFFDAGEDDGLAFLAMELVPGETLRARLRRGTIPTEDALAIVGGLLEALVHAHGVGVLHRDVKPENVMITGPRSAKLLDFGLARIERACGLEAPTATQLTIDGGILGTPGYAPPEQLRGDAVDARCDVFAVAATLYEMVSGHPAFPGSTAAARFAATLTVDPPRLEDPALPRGLDVVLARALDRNPAGRYPSASAFLGDLRALGEGRAIAELAPSLVVLDFEAFSSDPSDAWIGSGIAESVAGDLARLEGLHVVARDKALAARRTSGEDAGVIDVARRTGSRWGLHGSFQRSGGRLRVVAKLFDAGVGELVATEKLDGTIDEIFALQDRLSDVVAAHLNLAPPSSATLPPALDAYALYAKGRRAWLRLEKGGFDVAADCFAQAVAAAPGYAPALSGLAALHAMRFTFTTAFEDLERAAEYARRAIAAQPEVSEPRVWLGYALLRQLRHDDALIALGDAERMDPRQFFAPYFAAVTMSSLGRDVEAIGAYQRALAIEPDAGFGILGLAWSHTRAGHEADAMWCFERSLRLEAGHGPVATAGAGCVYAEALRRRGRTAEARDACMAGLAAVEASDHMYRDTMRTIGLVTLGRIAGDAGDTPAARAAFGQAVAHLNGRPRTLGGGWFRIQAAAGLAAANADHAAYDCAAAALAGRTEGEFSWIWTGDPESTAADLARAASALARDVH